MAYTGTSAVSDTDADIESSVHSSGYLLEMEFVMYRHPMHHVISINAGA